MGGAQTFGTALANLDKFAYVGGFRSTGEGRSTYSNQSKSAGQRVPDMS
jgi:hypothetical protein